MTHTIEAGDVGNTKAIWYNLYNNSSTAINVARPQTNKKRQVNRTSPQPYSRKCFDIRADVLNTQRLARFTTGSSKISGTLSPSLSTFLSPEPGARAKNQHELGEGINLQSPSICRSTPSPRPAACAFTTWVLAASSNNFFLFSTSASSLSLPSSGSSIIARTNASLSLVTTRTTSVRPLKNRRVVALSYVPPWRFHPRACKSRAYASCTRSCAHASGDTCAALIARLPYPVLITLIACESINAAASFSARAMLCSSAESSVHLSSTGAEEDRGEGEGEPWLNAGSANALQIASVSASVGVPSMTECSPMSPARALSNTINCTGLSTQR